MMPELSFNIDHGYLEGLLRGFKGGILKQTDYLNLVQCETLDGNIFSLFYFFLNQRTQLLFFFSRDLYFHFIFTGPG